MFSKSLGKEVGSEREKNCFVGGEMQIIYLIIINKVHVGEDRCLIWVDGLFRVCF